MALGQRSCVGGRRVRVSSGRAARPTARSVLVVEAKESRIGKVPVVVPKGVTYTLDKETNHLAVKGPKGQLERTFPKEMVFEEQDNALRLSKADDNRKARELHGLCRTLTNNMMVGVSEGFTKNLEMRGVGFRAAMEGAKTLTLNVGFSEPRKLDVPEGLSCEVVKNTKIVVTGIDKEQVGTWAAIIRDVRKPEPYKGKGIRYEGEYVALREGKRK